MYKKSDKILGKYKESLNNYIEGFDVYNSYFLSILSNPSIQRQIYEITVYEYRPDLIATDFYGSDNYLGILLIQTKLRLSDFKKGMKLELIPKDLIDKIISNI